MLAEIFDGNRCIHRTNEGLSLLTRYTSFSRARYVYVTVYQAGDATVQVHYWNGNVGDIYYQSQASAITDVRRARNFTGARLMVSTYRTATREEYHQQGETSVIERNVINERLRTTSGMLRHQIRTKSRKARALRARKRMLYIDALRALAGNPFSINRSRKVKRLYPGKGYATKIDRPVGSLTLRATFGVEWRCNGCGLKQITSIYKDRNSLACLECGRVYGVQAVLHLAGYRQR